MTQYIIILDFMEKSVKIHPYVNDPEVLPEELLPHSSCAYMIVDDLNLEISDKQL